MTITFQQFKAGLIRVIESSDSPKDLVENMSIISARLVQLLRELEESGEES